MQKYFEKNHIKNVAEYLDSFILSQADPGT